MKLKKIIATFVAAAVVTAVTAVNAFAATIEMDAEYPGAWSAGKTISKADLTAIGGDVKVTLNVTAKALVPDQCVLKPMDFDNGWVEVTSKMTSDSDIAKPDGFIFVKKSQTTVSFVIDAATIESLGDSGLGFQVYNVTINSAEITAGAPEGPFKSLEDKYSKDYCMETITYEEATGTAAPAEEAAATTDAAVETAPAADSATASTTTGNAPVAAAVVIMALAGTAAVVSKKKN